MTRLLIVATMVTGCATRPRRCDIPVAVGVPENNEHGVELWQVQLAADYWNDVTGIDLFVNFGRVPLGIGEQYSPVALFVYQQEIGNRVTIISQTRDECFISSAVYMSRDEAEETQTAMRYAMGKLLGLDIGIGALSMAEIESTQEQFNDLR